MPIPPLLVAELLLAACSDPTVQQYGLTFRSVRQGASQVWVADLAVEGNTAPRPFYHLPDQTRDVQLSPDLVSWLMHPDFTPKQVYVAVNPASHYYPYTAGVGFSGFVEDLSLFGGASVHMAFSAPSDRPERLPVLDCSRASTEIGVFLFEQGASNEVRREGSCIKAIYKVPQDAIRVTERLEYALIGAL